MVGQALLSISAGLLLWQGVAISAMAGTLTASYQPIVSNSVVDLSAEGALDWVHWGFASETSVDRKASVPPMIESFKTILAGGGEGPHRFEDNFNGYSWTGGAPTGITTNSPTGVYVIGKNCGFRLTVPADTTPRTLKVYVGAFAAKGQFNASLSDGSAPAYSDSSIENVGNGPSGCYAINFAAGSSNQALTISYTVGAQYDHQYANVTLQASTLASSAAAGSLSKSSAVDDKKAASAVDKSSRKN